MRQKFDVIVIGGGAAGFFTAINAVEKNRNLSVLILEQSKEVLNKVRISGGGRCNVTNSIWTPDELVNNYPRGKKELMGPFNKFGCGDTMAWFEERGVALKIEEDGRTFPVSDSSESIVNCLLEQIRKHDIKYLTGAKVKSIKPIDGSFEINATLGEYITEIVVMATGSSNQMWDLLATLDFNIVKPVPSLFTFNIKDSRLNGLMGLSVPKVKLSIEGTDLAEEGPLLITHWGLSGPAILRLSAWGAQQLAAMNYRFILHIDWLPDLSEEEIKNNFHKIGSKQIYANALGNIPGRLWKSLLSTIDIHEHTKWADLNKVISSQLTEALKNCKFVVNGKSTFKEEFVTAGGVDLKEINFTSFESKKLKNFYLVGEVINIDAITGGFNFQAAWTGGYLAGTAIASSFKK